MEFKSLSDLVRIAENALAVQFYGQSSILRKSVLKVLAHVLGALLYMLSLIAKRIWKNRFVSTCDVSALDGFGVEYGLPHKVPLAASGNVSVTLADGVVSVTIPQDTVLVDQTGKLAYTVKATTVINSGITTVPVMANEVGYDYNLDADTVLEFRDEAVSGVASMASVDVSGGVAEGVEIDGDVYVWGETAEGYRARLLNRIQNPVSGGSKNDYWLWATRFQFVTDAFVIPNKPEVNSVSVAIANYNSEAIAVGSDQVDEVSAYMTDDVRRPITADVRVFSVTPVDVQINAVVMPFNDNVKESVTAAIKRYLRTVPPGSNVTFADLEIIVRSNSIADTFTVTSAKKGTDSVSSLSFDLTYGISSVTAEVAKCSVSLRNGGA